MFLEVGKYCPDTRCINLNFRDGDRVYLVLNKLMRKCTNSLTYVFLTSMPCHYLVESCLLGKLTWTFHTFLFFVPINWSIAVSMTHAYFLIIIHKVGKGFISYDSSKCHSYSECLLPSPGCTRHKLFPIRVWQEIPSGRVVMTTTGTPSPNNAEREEEGGRAICSYR